MIASSRFSAALACLGVLSACVSAQSPAEFSPTFSPSEFGQTTPSPSALAEPTATASPSRAKDPIPFGWGDAVAITVNGLAVRRAPDVSAAFVFGTRWDEESQQWVRVEDEVRLDAGHIVVVNLGPVERTGIVWYRVHNIPQPGEEWSDTVQWDADNDDQCCDNGWIAGGIDGIPYVTASPEYPPEDHGTNAPLVRLSGSRGRVVSDTFNAEWQVAGEWVLTTGALAPCTLTVTLLPSGEVLADEALIGVFSSGRMASSESQSFPAGEYWIEVTAGVAGSPEAACPWSLVLFQVIG